MFMKFFFMFNTLTHYFHALLGRQKYFWKAISQCVQREPKIVFIPFNQEIQISRNLYWGNRWRDTQLFQY